MESNLKLSKSENSSEEKKELYQSPKVEILEIKVEKGFAASTVDTGGSGTGDWGSGTW
jgi:hypothetical protein